MQIRVEPGEERGATRCAYCHDALVLDEALQCPSCQVALHPACRDELGGCPTQGCGAGAATLASVGPRVRPPAADGQLDCVFCGQGSHERGLSPRWRITRCQACGITGHHFCWEGRPCPTVGCLGHPLEVYRGEAEELDGAVEQERRRAKAKALLGIGLLVALVPCLFTGAMVLLELLLR